MLGQYATDVFARGDAAVGGMFAEAAVAAEAWGDAMGEWMAATGPLIEAAKAEMRERG